MKIKKANVAAAAGLMAYLVGDSHEAALKQSVKLTGLTDKNWPLGLNVNPGPHDVFVRCYQNHPEEMIINLSKRLPCNNTEYQVPYNSTLHYKDTWINLATNLSKAYQGPDRVTPSIVTTLASTLDVSSTGSTSGTKSGENPLVIPTGDGGNTPFMASVIFWLIVLTLVVVVGAVYMKYRRPRYEQEAYQGMQDNIQGWYEVESHSKRLLHKPIVQYKGHFKLITALFSALAYLHRKHHLIHSDLKADNIGIARIKANGVPHLKLLDFGNAVHFEAKEYKAAERHSKFFSLDSNECDHDQRS